MYTMSFNDVTSLEQARFNRLSLSSCSFICTCTNSVMNKCRICISVIYCLQDSSGCYCVSVRTVPTL